MCTALIMCMKTLALRPDQTDCIYSTCFVNAVCLLDQALASSGATNIQGLSMLKSMAKYFTPK